jgi:hypothetical protein
MRGAEKEGRTGRRRRREREEGGGGSGVERRRQGRRGALAVDGQTVGWRRGGRRKLRRPTAPSAALVRSFLFPPSPPIGANALPRRRRRLRWCVTCTVPRRRPRAARAGSSFVGLIGNGSTRVARATSTSKATQPSEQSERVTLSTSKLYLSSISPEVITQPISARFPSASFGFGGLIYAHLVRLLQDHQSTKREREREREREWWWGVTTAPAASVATAFVL